jgi:hypothetical protein
VVGSAGIPGRKQFDGDGTRELAILSQPNFAVAAGAEARNYLIPSKTAAGQILIFFGLGKLASQPGDRGSGKEIHAQCLRLHQTLHIGPQFFVSRAGIG